MRGTVYGADGQPVPFARVDCKVTSTTRPTNPAASPDSAVRRTPPPFFFDYVRKTSCTDIFSLWRTSREGKHGNSSGRVRFVGNTIQLDIVMLGRGTIHGKVRYEDGSVPETIEVIGYSPVFFEGRKAIISADGSYEVGDLPVGPVTLGASDRKGSFVYQTVEIPTAGSVVTRDLVILRRAPGQQTTGDIRGVVHETDGTTQGFTPTWRLLTASWTECSEASSTARSTSDRADGRAEIEASKRGKVCARQVFFDVLRTRSTR